VPSDSGISLDISPNPLNRFKTSLFPVRIFGKFDDLKNLYKWLSNDPSLF